MNGKPGEDPVADIVHYGLSVYSAEEDGFVRELAKLIGFPRIQELIDSIGGLPADQRRAKLEETVLTLKREARERGWEVD